MFPIPPTFYLPQSIPIRNPGGERRRMDTTTAAAEASRAQFHSAPELRPVTTISGRPQEEEMMSSSSSSSILIHDGLSFWQYMIAGSVAGCVEHMAMFPVDTLKTRMQALGSCPLKSAGLRTAFRSILRSEGPAGFYRGISAMGLGAGPAHAVYFTVYEFCKKSMLSSSDSDNHNDDGGVPTNLNLNPHLAHALAGVCATTMSDAVFTPMDMVKQRLQLTGRGVTGSYLGVRDCVMRVSREEGLRAFYASYRTTLMMNAPYTAFHFSMYEAVKKALSPISPPHGKITKNDSLVHAAAGAAAGALAAFVTTPLDVVKTQLQCQGVCGCDRYANGSIRDVFGTIVKKDGYRGLMRGWIPRMLFHTPAAAISWATYEAGKSFFQKRVDMN